MGYDFMLDYDVCRDKYETFDDFVEACESVDKYVSVDYDDESVCFYDFSIDTLWDTPRVKFVKEMLGDDYAPTWKRQIEVQSEFRKLMMTW